MSDELPELISRSLRQGLERTLEDVAEPADRPPGVAEAAQLQEMVDRGPFWQEVQSLRALIAELLDNFDPYITAWEAKCPWSSDGENLAKRMRAAIGRDPSGADDGEPRSRRENAE